MSRYARKPFNVEVSSKYGAPMGRRSDDPSEFDLSRKLHIQRVPFVDGDYDKGGAYWGGYPSPPLVCVWDDGGHQFFTRLTKAGLKEVQEQFPKSAKWDVIKSR